MIFIKQSSDDDSYDGCGRYDDFLGGNAESPCISCSDVSINCYHTKNTSVCLMIIHELILKLRVYVL
jgi:hypothetical protein